MKVAINKCYGGFGLSKKAWSLLEDLGLNKDQDYHEDFRHNPLLIKVIEELGSEADGDWSELEIVTIPDDVEYQIDEYDGKEWVAETHRTWH